MRIARIKYACVFLVTILLIPVTAQERREIPRVSAEMLQGQRLVDKEFGASVLAPDNWVWVQLPQESPDIRSFGATNPIGLGYAVSLFRRMKFNWTHKDVEDLQVGMARKLEESGFKVNRRVFEQSSVPFPDSYRFVWTIVQPDGNRRFRFGYVGHFAQHGITLTCIGPDEREPHDFTSFVRSATLF